MDAAAQFGVWDYVVFVVVLLLSACIGLYYACAGGGQKTAGEFLMASRSMGVFPISLSLLASFLSGITLIGMPAEIYSFGVSYVLIVFGLCCAVVFASFFYLPVFYGLEVTSAYEYLSRRFNNALRIAGSGIFVIHMVLYMAIVTYAPALALSQVTGLHLWGCVAAIGGVCIFYTGIGGMKAVMWTDAAQTFVMYASMMVVAIKGCVDSGGWDFLWQKNSEGGRLHVFEFGVDPTIRHSVWALSFGGFFTWLATYGTNQAQVQRFLTSPSQRKAQIAVWLNIPGFIIINALCCFVGLVLYAQYWNCDPVRSKKIQATDQLLPLFVMELLGGFPGLPGLFVAGVFSGALSTLSSGLNSLAAVTLEDFVKVLIVKDISEEKAGTLSKVLAVVYGIVSIALVAAAQNLGNITQATISIFGMISGPILGLFTLGMFFPWANSLGAVVGLVTGFSFVLWIGIGAQIAKPPRPFLPVSTAGCPSTQSDFNVSLQAEYFQSLFTTPTPSSTGDDIFILYRLSYLWYSVISFFTVIIIGLIASCLSGVNSVDDVEPELLSPLTKWILSYFSRNGKKKPLELVVWKEKLNHENGVGSADSSLKLNRSTTEINNKGTSNPTFNTD